MKLKSLFSEFPRAVRLAPRAFAAIFILSVLTAILNLMIPIQLRALLESLQSAQSPLIPAGQVFLLLLVLFSSSIANIFNYVAADTFGGVFLKHILARAQERIHRAPFAEINRIGTARLKSILSQDAIGALTVIGHHVPKLLCSFTILLCSLFLSSFFDLRITLLLLVSFLFGISLSYFSKKKIAAASGRTNAKIKQFSRVINSYVESLPTVRANNLEAYYIGKSCAAVDDFIESSVKEDKLIYFFSGLVGNYNLIIQMILSAVLALPVYQHSIVNMAFYMILFTMIMGHAQNIEGLLQLISRHLVSFRNLESIYDLTNNYGTRNLQGITSIEGRELGFGYEGMKTKVLEGLSFSYKAGDVVRIEGTNGSGKSSLLKLLMNFDAPCEGEILVNGIPLRELSYESIAENILYVGQDELLLNESVERYLNLLSGEEQAAEEREALLASLRLGRIHQEICDLGKNFSGGQRKKLLLAKLQLCAEKASLLLIDEIDSGMDAEIRRDFETWLNALDTSGKIVFFIQHSAESTIRYNRRLVLR